MVTSSNRTAGLNKPIMPIEGKRMVLRELIPEDVSDRYVGWMNDPDITRFLETRFQRYTKEMLTDYAADKRNDRDSAFLGMILKKAYRHIGNIKLGPIDWMHARASVGIMIGEKDSFGLGYATEAIGLVIDFAFFQVNLHKLTSGCYEKNIGARKAFEKNGFVVEGIRKQHVLCDGEFMDVVELGLINPTFGPKSTH